MRVVVSGVGISRSRECVSEEQLSVASESHE